MMQIYKGKTGYQMDEFTKNKRKDISELSFADADRILKNVMESCGREPVPLKKAVEMLEKDRLACKKRHFREE